MASSVDRGTYCPLYQVQDDEGVSYLVLDTLSAAYEGLRDQNISCDTFTVTDAETAQPDAIAYRFYGNAQLWWLLCSYNGILDPYTELVPGVKLLIPRLDEVLIYLTRDSAVVTPSLVNRVGSIGEI